MLDLNKDYSKEYPDTLSPEELAHYGVLGMKWGIRKDIGKEARSAARLELGSKKLGRKISNVEKKIGKKLEKGKDITKVKVSLKKLNATKKRVDALLQKKHSQLSEKDIKQGRRAVTTMKIMKMTLAGAGIAFTAGAGAIAGAAGASGTSLLTGATVITIDGVSTFTSPILTAAGKFVMGVTGAGAASGLAKSSSNAIRDRKK